jgi:Neuraminidase (sialidase)
MARVNEVAFVRAANGDIVAACRTDNPDRFAGEIDHYGGLAVCASKDDGTTWSSPVWLYEWGRHHPSMVLMPSGHIVMTYVVRVGHTDTADGFRRFGIEAVVSRDNGLTWDPDHRYILASWPSTIQGPKAWYPSSQATSSVLLPDGSILTAFGTGYHCNNPPDGRPTPRDVGLVRWRVNNRGLRHDRTIRDAPYDSARRNVFHPDPSTMPW